MALCANILKYTKTTQEKAQINLECREKTAVSKFLNITLQHKIKKNRALQKMQVNMKEGASNLAFGQRRNGEEYGHINPM